MGAGQAEEESKKGGGAGGRSWGRDRGHGGVDEALAGPDARHHQLRRLSVPASSWACGGCACRHSIP